MQSDNEIQGSNENNKPEQDSCDDLSRPQWLPRWLFAAIGPISLIVVVFGGLAAYYAYHYVTKDSVRFQFWVSFMFSFLAFVVLLVQSVIYAQQAEFMKQQSKAMRDSVERTDTIIETMDAQIKATERNTVYAQRAYVYAKIGGVLEDIFDITLLIENAGNSPAVNVRLSYSADFRRALPHKARGDWDKFHAGYPIGVLPPRIHYPHILYHRPVPTPQDLQRYYSRYWSYHVWGEITYQDVFGNDWYTSFAFDIRNVGNVKINVFPGLTGNEAT